MAKTIYLGMGCFWGAEKKFWSLPGVIETSVGYQGGHTEDPTYKIVCAGGTNHIEIVKVVYDESVIPTREILRVFWENHDPTQGMRQGNDVGTQYRSAIFYVDDEQKAALCTPEFLARAHGAGTDYLAAAFAAAAPSRRVRPSRTPSRSWCSSSRR